ncbi:hypothetical protein P280DRAFT_473112 [Massarina eburnea CBS 473.64]|uniref:RING-type domain-containing protein n=1 Tax=Massarina eburnea CBS 473.64 TaxID=1395130 RepID=A0A6A6RPY2_9PLEO|nr:hypothetical protein P280DRAFT_473112 [Massarina eburnea CBS 473.64]
MAPPYGIYALPMTRRKYDINTQEPEPSNREEWCSICYRPFHEKDDPSDVQEIPCQPIELQPCKHIIGSQCFARLIQANMDACQICRAKIALISDPVPQWLQYATSWSWYTLYCDYVPGHAVKVGKHDDYMRLSHRLFNDHITNTEGLQLWWHYMDSLSEWTRTVIKCGVLVKAAFALSALFVNTSYLELQMLRTLGFPSIPDSRLWALGIDFPLLLATIFFAGKYDLDHVVVGTALLFPFARVFVLAFTVKWFLVLLALNWMVYGVLTALLIWYGMKESEN